MRPSRISPSRSPVPWKRRCVRGPTTGSGCTAAGRRGRSRLGRMNPDLAQLLGRFSKARIVAVGDLVADEFIYGETDRISREAPVLIVRYESAELKPGCGANAILNLCALGARVQAIGLVGDDEIGRRLRALLRDAGADDSTVFPVEGPTSTKTRVLAGARTRAASRCCASIGTARALPDPRSRRSW